MSLQASGEIDISASARVDAGTLLEGVMHSDALDTDLPYRIYLPPGYHSSQERYPVLYLLHGNGGDYTEWSEGHLVANFADAMISEGRIRPMVIVMPEGDHSYFINYVDNGLRWADYIVEDVVNFVDSRYRTLPDREHRAIGGISMGAVGALHLAFNHPDRFSIVGAHSPSLFDSLEDLPAVFGDAAYFANYDPLKLSLAREGLRSLQMWVDTSEDDSFRGTAGQLHANLDARGIDHHWQVYPGIHFTTQWIRRTPEYLEFYSAAFGSEQ